MVEPAPNSGSARLPPQQPTLGLWLIVIGNILFSSGAFALITYYEKLIRVNPFFSGLSFLIVGIISAQVVYLSVSMFLLEFRRSLKWITTLFILTASAAMLSLACFIGQGGLTHGLMAGLNVYAVSRMGIIFAFMLTLGTLTVLGLQILIWPVAASLGWQMRPVAQDAVRASPRFSLFQLFGWVGFVAAFLSLVRTLVALDEWWLELSIFLLLWLVPALLAAVPTLLLAARALRPSRYLALFAYLAIVSFLESAVTFIPFRTGVTGVWWPTWTFLILNVACAATIVANSTLLRACGLIMDLPLWPRRISANLNRRSSSPVAR